MVYPEPTEPQWHVIRREEMNTTWQRSESQMTLMCSIVIKNTIPGPDYPDLDPDSASYCLF